MVMFRNPSTYKSTILWKMVFFIIYKDSALSQNSKYIRLCYKTYIDATDVADYEVIRLSGYQVGGMSLQVSRSAALACATVVGVIS